MKSLGKHFLQGILAIALCVCTVALASAAAEGEHKLINPEKATIEQLTKLPGVSEELANAIFDFREQIGGLQKIDDLLEVKGFTPELLEKLRPLLTLDPLKTDCGC